MATKRYITFIYYILLTAICANAQSIKEQLEQKQRQEQYEREQRNKELKEQARIKNAQLHLKDLLQLMQSKDLVYVEQFLTNRGWKQQPTEEKTTTNNRTVIWAFDKKDNDLARGWFYFYLYPTDDNAITYSITDNEQLNQLKSEIISNSYERIYPTNAIEHDMESTYRSGSYEVNFKKDTDICYDLSIYNYKQSEKRKAEVASAISKAIAAFDDGRFSDTFKYYTEAANNSTKSSRISIKEAASLKFQNKAERLIELNGECDEVSALLLQYADNLNSTVEIHSLLSKCK